MGPERRPRVLSERQGKWLLSLYPPLLFGGVRVLRFGPGFRSCRVRIARSLLTRNLSGSTFGGTIFSGADPFHAIMYWQILARRGLRSQVWLRRARIDYLKPATTPLWLDFVITDEDVEEVERLLERDGRAVRCHRTEARGSDGSVCAVIEVEVYLGRSRNGRRPSSTF